MKYRKRFYVFCNSFNSTTPLYWECLAGSNKSLLAFSLMAQMLLSQLQSPPTLAHTSIRGNYRALTIVIAIIDGTERQNILLVVLLFAKFVLGWVLTEHYFSCKLQEIKCQAWGIDDVIVSANMVKVNWGLLRIK